MENILVEFAGRDSIVAFLNIVRTKKEKCNFIFTIVEVPSEDNENIDIFTLTEILELYANKYNHEIVGNYYISEFNDVWFKYMNEALKIDKSLICVNCHSFCHLLRFSLAKEFNASILTGERLYHKNGDLNKLNQSKEYTDSLDKIAKENDITFLRPLYNIKDDNIIKNIYEEFLKEYDIEENDITFRRCFLELPKLGTMPKDYDKTLETMLDDINKKFNNKQFVTD